MADRMGQQFGNYRLVQLLGQGGFADVYLGEHLYLKTQAALKILQIKLGTDALEDFLREAQTIVRLEHKHIVRVLECGVEDQTPFLVMNYAPGGSLRQRYPKGSRLSLVELVRYVKQVASALQYAHDRRLIHRDIKPENILLEHNNDVLLSDFGLVAIVQSTGSQTVKEMAGTIPYMAPEQLQGKARPASDQYGLGIVTYEWLSGERPFQGSFVEIASQHVLAPPPALCGRIAGISPNVERVVFTALAKDPGQRFTTVLAFADALEQAYQTEQYRPLNLSSSSPSLDQSSLSTFVKVLPDQTSQSTVIVTPPNAHPAQLSQSSQPTYLIMQESLSQEPTIVSNQQVGRSSLPIYLKDAQPALYSRPGQITPVPNQISQPAQPRRHATRWPIIALLAAMLVVLLILLPFVLIPGLSRGTGIGGTSPTPTAPLASSSPHAVKQIPTSIPTHASTTMPTQVPSSIPTQAPTTIPTEAPTATPTQVSTPTPTPSPSPSPTPSPTPTLLGAPAQISPANGTVFNNYPRTTTLVWSAVSGAVSYTVQIYYYQPGNTTCTGGSPDGTITGITGTSYTFNFVGAQPGCWQVWAVDSSGQQGSKSPLWEFSYTQ